MNAQNNFLLIETCIWHDKKFIPLRKINKLFLENPDYVEGSVRVMANGVTLLDDLNWNDLDFWWSQMISMIELLVLKNHTYAIGHFTNQPTTMRLIADGDRLTWEVNGSITRSATLDFWTAIHMLYEHCKFFFTRIKVLNPTSSFDQDLPLLRLAKLAPALRRPSQS